MRTAKFNFISKQLAYLWSERLKAIWKLFSGKLVDWKQSLGSHSAQKLHAAEESFCFTKSKGKNQAVRDIAVSGTQQSS